VLLLRDLAAVVYISFLLIFISVPGFTSSLCVCFIQTGKLEEGVLSCRSKAIDRHLQLLDRYRNLPSLSSSTVYPTFLPDIPFSSSSFPESESLSPSQERLLNKPLFPFTTSMGTPIKINSFSGGNAELCEDVEE